MDSAEVSTAVNEPLDLVKLSLSELVEQVLGCYRFWTNSGCFALQTSIHQAQRGPKCQGSASCESKHSETL